MRPPIVEEYLDAHNHHDLEKIMSLFTDGIRFQMGEVWEKVGKGEVEKLEEWDIAVNSRLEASDMRWENDTVECRLKESNDWYTLAGIREVVYERCTITVQDGKIARINTELTPQSMMGVTEALKSIMDWAGQEKPRLLTELMPDGELIYGRENAGRWMEMLAAWSEARRND